MFVVQQRMLKKNYELLIKKRQKWVCITTQVFFKALHKDLKYKGNKRKCYKELKYKRS